MLDDFSWWQNALKGVRGPIHDGEPQSGYYRQRRQDKTYEPVAYWKDSGTGEQRCHINGRSVDTDRMMHTWPFAAKYPITEEAYWHRLDTGQWGDDDAGAIATAAGPEIDPATDPVGSLKAEIDKARAGLPAYATVDSDEQAAKAQTLRSALTTLSGKADKARKIEKEPHLQAGRDVDAKWNPLVNLAADGAAEIRKALMAWETIKLENQRRADEETRKRQAEATTAPPEPIKPNTPPPSNQIKGASGRAASVGVRKVVKSIELNQAFEQFGGLPEVYNLFMELAQKAVDAGRDVPGAEIKEEATVR